MLESTCERTRRISTETIALHSGIVKKTLHVMNICSWGMFNPNLAVIERLCDLYETTGRTIITSWLNAVPVEAEAVQQPPAERQLVKAVRETFAVEQRTEFQPQEQAIMDRQRPDYSNLRANAEEQRQSIIDNDDFWEGMQGSNTKSAYRQRAVRERNWVDNRLNEEST